jgi:hypothetical protein
MDVQQLCAVLQGCLSSNREERSQAEALLKQVGCCLKQAEFADTPPHCSKQWCPFVSCMQHETSKRQLVTLLRVAGEPTVDLSVRQVASITFKQAAKRHWEPENEGKQLVG